MKPTEPVTIEQPSPRSAEAPSRREEWLRAARLYTGLILMAFVILHFTNHALALISLETAERGRHWFLFLWRNPVGTLLFYGALLVHAVLALLALYRRRTLKMPPREAAQVILGLMIPVLIAEHVVGTRGFSAMTGVRDTYAYVANALWIASPFTGLKQAVAVVAVWLHGCLGVFFWLRHRPWFGKAATWLLVASTLLPVLALLGLVDAGRAVEANPYTGLAGFDPATIATGLAMKARIDAGIYAVFGLALGFVLVLRILRAGRERRNQVVIRYPGNRQVRVPKGYSVLEASRLAGIPHNAVCGGRGRCSTCRVVVQETAGDLPPPSALEQATLDRIHAGPAIRLACQLRPTADIAVEPLLGVARDLDARSPGREQDVAVLFCDIRGFTALSDRRLPYDTVFLLNRYFALVGRAVEDAGGRLDKFIGDGAMAVFGFNASKREACRRAVDAARAIVAGLASLSEELAGELPAPLRVAIGIHVGPAIAGSMGYGQTMHVTVIGDTVNIASRLESVAKELDATLVVSSDVARLAGIGTAGLERHRIDIRGRAEPLDIEVLPQGAAVPDSKSIKEPA